MAEHSLSTLGNNGNAARKAPAKKSDDREVLDVTKPYDVTYACFDENFFNTGTRTIMLGNHFAAGDRDAEGIVERMVMHPNGCLEMVLVSRITANKVSTVVLFKVKNCTPNFAKYRSQYAAGLEK